MIDDSLFPRDKSRDFKALERAKERTANYTIPIKMNDFVVYVTPEQAADENYIAMLRDKYDKAREMW